MTRDWKMSGAVIKARVSVHNRSSGRTTVVEVSTSDIPSSPETCLFWPGDSSVVEVYATWDEAREGHARWAADPHRVVSAMLAAGWRSV